MLRASMRTSEKVNSWPYDIRYFWTQLWGYCDSFGRGRYDNRLVKAGTLPLDDEATIDRVGRWMQALELAGVIRGYEVGGKRYFECVNWNEHQESPYFKKTDIPDESGFVPPPGKRSEVLQIILEHSRLIEGEVEREVEGKARALTPFCIKHPDGTDSPCRACGNARRSYDAALLALKNKPTPVPPRTLDECPDHRGYPLPCVRCAETKVA